jgi:predicted transcriptional regulator
VSKIDKTVGDHAIPLDVYPHLRDDQTLHEALCAMQAFPCEGRVQFSELLILNDQKQLIGRVTVREILQGLEPRLLREQETRTFEGFEAEYPNLAILWEDSFFEQCHKHLAKPIKEFLSPIKAVVKASDPLLKALYIIMHTQQNNLPVLEGDRVIGMIRIKEIFAAVCGHYQL